MNLAELRRTCLVQEAAIQRLRHFLDEGLDSCEPEDWENMRAIVYGVLFGRTHCLRGGHQIEMDERRRRAEAFRREMREKQLMRAARLEEHLLEKIEEANEKGRQMQHGEALRVLMDQFDVLRDAYRLLTGQDAPEWSDEGAVPRA